MSTLMSKSISMHAWPSFDELSAEQEHYRVLIVVAYCKQLVGNTLLLCIWAFLGVRGG